MDESGLFLTHHSPLGCAASFTFGAPGRGFGIERTSPLFEPLGDLLVAVSNGKGNVRAWPFLEGVEDVTFQETQGFGAAGTGWGVRQRWRFVKPDMLRRRLTCTRDTLTDGALTLCVHTPHYTLEQPDTMPPDELRHRLCPGIVITVSLDNTAGTEPLYGFFGVARTGAGRLHAFDAKVQALAGVGFRQDWAFAARPAKGVHVLRNHSIAHLVQQAQPLVHNSGHEGGLLFEAAPGETASITIACAMTHFGPVTQGMVTRYAWTEYFDSTASVCSHLLDNAERIIDDCRERDSRLCAEITDPAKRSVLAQALRGYYANQQVLLDSNGSLHYNIGEGAYCWRNTFDLAADHLAFELRCFPWATRKVLDEYDSRGIYHDRITFDDDRWTEGGVSFAHDLGSFQMYAAPGASAYEWTGPGCAYGTMTTEQLLNGAFCYGAYCVTCADREWREQHAQLFDDMLRSIENRDHVDASLRDGVPIAKSDRCNPQSEEITTYDCLSPALKDARGCSYIVVKTWSALLVLESVFRKLGMSPQADRAREGACRSAARLEQAFDESRGMFPANVLTGDDSPVLAIADPLGVPMLCGLEPVMREFDGLLAKLRTHFHTCLSPNHCLAGDGMLLLCPNERNNSWPSKVILCLAVAERLLGLDLDGCDRGLLNGVRRMLQVIARDETLSDQIDVVAERVIGGMYYPRMVTAAFWDLPGETRD